MSIPDLYQKGKVVVVTGARRGLGKAMALAFAEAGADIAISDMVAEDGLLEATGKQAEAFGRHVLTMQTDVTKKRQVIEMVGKTVERFGRIDVLINNAGSSGGKNVLEIEEADWDLVINTSLKGTLFCSQAVSKIMMAQKSGSIINLSSVGAFLKGSGPYAVAKKAIVSVTQGFAALLGPYGVRVNAIAPGAIRTDMTRVFWGDPTMLTYYNGFIPLGRLGEPEDIAHIALFLASDASRYITGATIMADGGSLPVSLPPGRPNQSSPQPSGRA